MSIKCLSKQPEDDPAGTRWIRLDQCTDQIAFTNKMKNMKTVETDTTQNDFEGVLYFCWNFTLGRVFMQHITGNT